MNCHMNMKPWYFSNTSLFFLCFFFFFTYLIFDIYIFQIHICILYLKVSHCSLLCSHICFFLWKVKLWCDCPFWPEDGMCRLRDCSVCECAENEFPETFKKPFNHGLSPDNPVCQEGKPEAVVDRSDLDSTLPRYLLSVTTK